jgi:hypothetical protein
MATRTDPTPEPIFTGTIIPVDIPAGVQAPRADRISEWLKDHGADIEGVMIRPDARVVRIALNDPTQEAAIRAGIAQYAGQKTRRETFIENAIADAKPLFVAIKNKPRADRTNIEKCLLGLAALLSDELT